MLNEPGTEVATPLLNGALISTVNLSEIYRKLVDSGVALELAVNEVARYRLQEVDFDQRLAAEAARLRPLTRHLGLSFADRACLALAGTMLLPVYTADRDWALLVLGIDIRLIR